MILTETCGCGAAITIEDGPGEAHTVGVRRALIDEFRTLHAPCRSDSRAVLTAQATTWPESTTVIVNAADGPPGDIEDADDARRARIGYTLDWDPYGPEEVSDAHRLELVADYLERVNARREVENRVPGDLRRIAADLRAGTSTEAEQRQRAERAEAIVSSLDGWSAGSAPEGRTAWPYTTPTGYVWQAPTTYDDLVATVSTVAQAIIEGWAGNEHPPAPTWEMVGLVQNELAALVQVVAATLAAGDTGSEYHAWHELLAIAEGRSEHVLPDDVGVSASTLRRIGELRRYAVDRIEAERDAEV